ncbi:P-loop NTPase fold protein [Erwinia sp. S59]|uniref:P-loop NTPase fold protein n=1 Tax=Erwinia sp. S59 TaxID=2769340 RepID=UPI00190CD780|nr:P-loop NTPase fold protein [Erwinia sp. S59]MBK0093456.1 hypothetical protein [Erwinia sp. S59]
MSLNIHTDAPSKIDMFEGKAHENLAVKISEIALDDNINIIGLDGYLGSGKSTIIDMAIDKISDDDIHVIKFDSEIYHYGATKKALIDILYDGFKKAPNVNADELLKCKDYALGNIYNYKKIINSKISIWTVAFICSTVLSLQSLRYFISDLSGLITKNELPYSYYVKVALEFLLVVSPMVIGLFYVNGKDITEENGSRKLKKPSLGDILKRNSEDTITEKIIINKEVGTLELKAALEGFVRCIPESARLILIVDNLDRISPTKIKEIWSDIELITEIAGSNLKIIIPYSGKHVAQALSDDNHEGLEFISKRIPVTFFVPPLISAGWRNGFIDFWKKTFDLYDENECYEICELIERWLPKNYSAVTPRFIKRMINDIKVTCLTFPSFKHDKILVAFYVLMCRYGLIEFKSLIINYNEKTPKDDDLIEVIRMQVTHRQFDRIFDSEDEWKKGLICIHFQTNSEFAISELIEEPLLNAIKYRKPMEYIELSSMYGFDKTWRKALHDSPIDDLILFLESMSNTDKSSAIKICPEIISQANKNEFLSGEYAKNIVDSLVNINNSIGLNTRESFIVKKTQLLKNKISSSSGFYDLDYITRTNTFEELNSLIGITKESFSDYFPEISGDIFFEFLLGKKERYQNLDIDRLNLTLPQLVKGVKFALESEIEFNLFSDQVINGMKINNSDFEDFINGEVLAAIEERYKAFMAGAELNTILDLRILCLDKRWRTTNLVSYFPYQTKILESHPNDYYAALISHKINIGDKSPTPALSSLELTGEFQETLYNYLMFSKNLDVIVSALEVDELKPLISPSLNFILDRGKVKRLHTNTFIRTMYGALKNISNVKNVMSFFNDWDSFADSSIGDKNHDQIDKDFIYDLRDVDTLTNFKEKVNSLINDKLSSKASVTEFIRQASSIYLEMISLVESKGGTIDFSKLTRTFSDFYTDEDIKSLSKSNYARSIVSLLNADDLDEVLKSLMDLLERTDLDSLRKVYLIRDFGDLLKYDQSISQNDNRAIARLFTYANDHKFLAKWLDAQSFSLSKWNSADKKTVETFVLNNTDIFPTLIKTRYFQKRIISNEGVTETLNKEENKKV